MTSASSSPFREQARLLDARSRALWRAALRVTLNVLLVAIGLALAISFDAGHYLSTRTSVVWLFLLTVIGMVRCRFAPFSPLTRLMLALYTAAFIGCYGYLFNLQHLWFYTPLSVAYMSDPVTIQIMTMTGLIGLCGLLTGYIFAGERSPAKEETFRATWTLKPLPFFALLVAAFVFAYINVPSETIFSSVYTAARGVAGAINFNAASMVAFTLLMLLIVDAEQETQPASRRWKRNAVIVMTALIVIVLLLLHGRRDTFGYLVGMAAMYLTEPLPSQIENRVRRRRFAFLSITGFAFLMIFFFIGDLRVRAVTHEELPFFTMIGKGMTDGFTGTAVLL